ncbi:MAG TPA: hypothetical protein VE338_03995 [Ktedonobacterales bacterium]|jgi:hypothetical protein|nr:hypothetical protein [Ktedonobacterales bacterium]
MKRLYGARRMFAVGALFAAVFGASGGPVLAASNPSGTGQPSQTCLSSTAPNEPGNAKSASGSAFNETRPGTAGTVYAGNGVSAITAGSANAVSQYDVACYQVSQTHP